MTSRWRKSATTMGPVGRVSWSVGVLLMIVFCVLSGDLFAIVAALFVAPVVLRSVWAKARIVEQRSA